MRYSILCLHCTALSSSLLYPVLLRVPLRSVIDNTFIGSKVKLDRVTARSDDSSTLTFINVGKVSFCTQFLSWFPFSFSFSCLVLGAWEEVVFSYSSYIRGIVSAIYYSLIRDS